MSGGAGGPSSEMGQEPPMIRRKGRSSASMIAVIAVIIAAVLVALGGYEAGWFRGSPASTSGTGNCTLPAPVTLTGDGSTLVAPLMSQWATVYHSFDTVNYGGGGSSQGITDITAKVVDFGATDAPLNHAQRTAASGVLTIPESAGGVVPIYNLAGVGTLNFNGSVLAQIYAGTITSWNDTALQALNPTAHLPTQTIVPVHRTGGSGTTFIWTSFLSLQNHAWLVTYGKGTTFPTNISSGVGQSGNGGVAAYVSNNPNTIGYVDLNYALNSGSGIGIGAVKNPSGNFIRATVANTASALTDSAIVLPNASGDWYNVSALDAPGTSDYPITSLTYVLVYHNLSAAYGSYNQSKADNLVDFLTWIVTVGQNYSALLYYVPLPAYIVAHDKLSIDSMTFGAAAVPVCVPALT